MIKKGRKGDWGSSGGNVCEVSKFEANAKYTSIEFKLAKRCYENITGSICQLIIDDRYNKIW